jgi:hypothetical protein
MHFLRGLIGVQMCFEQQLELLIRRFVGFQISKCFDASSVCVRRFGVLNKVVLLFPYQWWDDHDTFGHVADADEDPGWCYLWYCFPGLSGVLMRLLHYVLSLVLLSWFVRCANATFTLCAISGTAFLVCQVC